ncbi:cadherin repeat domain-containing protein [Gammaproteobacteria bacterium]|nr:cadherin repeat domain-containing protein [Gammaproteobacteria bacterium]
MSFNFNKPATQAVFFCFFLVSCNGDAELESAENSIESTDISIIESSPPISEIITENAQAIKGVSATLEGLDGSIQKNTQAIEKLSADLATGDNLSLTSLNTQVLGVNSSSSQTTNLLNLEGQTVNSIREIASIPENSTIAATIKAQDEDGSSQLKYSLSNASGSSDEDILSIDGETGVVTFKSAPNYEDPLDKNKDNTFHFSVIASDGLLSAIASYSFSITNVNERPVISLAKIDDIEEGKTLVATISAFDPDANTSLTYTFISAEDSDLFTIGAKTGVIKFKTTPDHEKPRDSGSNNSINFSVKVSDGALVAVQEYSFDIVNRNEPPSFDTTIPSINDIGNLEEGNTQIASISASDSDVQDSLTYSLINSVGAKDEGLISINKKTGIVSFKVSPDYEKPIDVGSDNSINFSVQVSDGALIDVQEYSFAITNKNEAPVITTTIFSISENNVIVGAISASDVDSGTTLSYGLAAGAGSDEQLFDINSTTGALVFKSRPDYETPKDNGGNNTYNISVTASDGSIKTSKVIEITVQNVNEAPSFL